MRYGVWGTRFGVVGAIVSVGSVTFAAVLGLLEIGLLAATGGLGAREGGALLLLLEALR